MLGNGIEAFGLRDDAAVVSLPGGGPLVVSVDSVVEGVHVDLSICSPADVGWKALMGALSDLAAVGAAPLGALVALCVPGGSGHGELALGVMGGVAEASAASGCQVVGGDVSEAGQLAVAVTVLGTVEPGGRPPVSRAGARPGDVVVLTGPCGASAAGLRELRARGSAAADKGDLPEAYRRPVARVREGQLGRARRRPRHDRRLRRTGARPASPRRCIRCRVRVDLGPDCDRRHQGGGVGGRRGLRVGDRRGRRRPRGDGESLSRAAGLRAPVPLGVVTAESSTRTLGGHPLERLGWQHTVG